MKHLYYVLEYDAGEEDKYFLLRSRNKYVYEIYNGKTHKWKTNKYISKKMFEVMVFGKHDASTYKELLNVTLIEIFQEYFDKNDVESIKKLYKNLKQQNTLNIEEICK